MDMDNQFSMFERPSDSTFPQVGQPKYKNVHFNIISAYQYDRGFPDQSSSDAFHQETEDLFTAAGWQFQKAGSSSSCDRVILGKSELHLHPMDITGIIAVELIPDVEKLIHQASTFRLNVARECEGYIEMDDDTYRQYLESRREDIQAAILTRFQTRRRNLFIAGDQSEAIARPFMLHRMEAQNAFTCCDDLSIPYVRGLIEEMVTDGRLTAAPTRHGRGLRTTGVTKPPRKKQRESR